MKTSAYLQRYDNLRTWLKDQRLAQGLSQRDAGKMMGCHHSVIGKIEHSRRNIEIVEFVEYCEALGVDPHEGLSILITSTNT